MSVLSLVRPELVDFKPYVAAQYAPDSIRLNANENPFRARHDESSRGLNWYPPLRPVALNQSLAAYYGVAAQRLLITRGTSEAIDLLIRLFCTPGSDSVVVCEPTFSMYRVYAELQGAAVRNVARREPPNFDLDVDTILSSWRDTDKLLFLTSPNNPTGRSIPQSEIHRLVEGLRDRAIVIIDSAYCEFSESPDPQLDWQHEAGVVVLRTLSKAFGLAGARCGAMIGAPELVSLADGLLPPYALATPVIDAVNRALQPENLRETTTNIATLTQTRAWFVEALEKIESVIETCPSDSNFVFVRLKDAQQVLTQARAIGLLLRDYPEHSQYRDYLRISIGERKAMTDLLQVLRNSVSQT